MASINTVFTLTDNFTSSLNRINQSLDKTALKMFKINQAVLLFNTVGNVVNKLGSYSEELYDAYSKREEREMKLATVMRQRTNATNEEIDSIKRLCDEQERLGIYSSSLIMNGAQELATFVSQREELDLLVPALGHLIAQQYGFKASADQVRTAATMMGRTISGKEGGLSRVGYIFTDAQLRVLQTGTAMEKASMLAEILVDNVGQMNYALAKTSIGRLNQMQNSLLRMKEQAAEASRGFIFMKRSIEVAFETKKIELFLKALDYVKTHTREVGVAIMSLGTIMAAIASFMVTSWAIIHWPIVLVVAAIGLVIYYLNKMGVTTQQVGGIVGTIIQSIYVVIHTIITFIENVAIYIINRIIDIYNFFKSIFGAVPRIVSNPMNILKQQFVNLATFILKILGPLLGLFDKIFQTKTLESLKNRINEVQESINKDNENKFDFETVNHLGYKEYYKGDLTKGTRMGESAGEKVEEFLGMIGTNFGDMKFEFDSNGNLLVKDNELVEIAKDYRELLSRRAIEKFNLQFSQVTPSINIDNVVVNKEVDATRVFDEVTNALDEYANSSLTR